MVFFSASVELTQGESRLVVALALSSLDSALL